MVHPNRPQMERLEDRLLFDAAPVAQPLSPEPNIAAQPVVGFAQSQQLEITSPGVIVVIDPSVSRPTEQIERLMSAHANQLEIHLINKVESGIDQISSLLEQLSEPKDSGSSKSIYLLTQADEKGLRLGGDLLDQNSLTLNADKIASWGNALASDSEFRLHVESPLRQDESIAPSLSVLLDSISRLIGHEFRVLPELTPPAEQFSEIAFVDSSISQYEQLVAELAASGQVEIVTLDSNSDGLSQIAAALAGRNNVAALHIVSHGSEGQLFLGNAVLNAESMQAEHLEALLAIGAALHEDGDILIYGCDFAANDAGLRAAIILGGITGADIAASDDLTGYSRLGGNWVLERHLGTVDHNSLAAANWGGLLAPAVANNAPFVVTSSEFDNLDNEVIDFQGGRNTINLTNLAVNTAVGTEVTVEFWMFWDGIEVKMPFGFSLYDLWFFDGTFGFNTGNGDIYGVSSAGLAGGWHHVAAVFHNGDAQQSRLVIDGIDQVMGQLFNSPINTFAFATANAQISGWGYTRGFKFDGKIDEVRIWNGARSVDEIRANMHVQLSGPHDNLVASYSFTGATTGAGGVIDDSGNGNHGTMSAMTIANVTTLHGFPAFVDSVIYIENALPQTVLPGITIYDDANLEHANIKISGGFQNGEDVLTFEPQNGITGVFSGDTLTLTGTATVAQYQDALRTITYVNTSDNPATVDRIIHITVSDGILDSNTAITTIHIIPTNDPPVAVDDDFEIDGSASATVVGNAIDNDNDIDGDSLEAVPQTGIVGSNGGIFSIAADGTIEFDPNGDFDHVHVADSRTTTIQYTIVDPSGATSTATIAITVIGVNNSPIAINDSYDLQSPNASGSAFDNDIDPDGHPVSGAITLGPQHGTVEWQPNGTFTYTPGPDFSVSDQFTYVIQDIHGASSTAVVYINRRYAWDSLNDQSATLQPIFEKIGAFRREVVLLSQRLEPLAFEPILAGYARPGSQLVGRVYSADGSLLSESSVSVNAAGNWVLQFYGLRATGPVRIVIEQLITEEIARGDLYGFSLTADTYRSLQMGVGYNPGQLGGSILSDTPSLSLDIWHRDNVHPLRLL